MVNTSGTRRDGWIRVKQLELDKKTQGPLPSSQVLWEQGELSYPHKEGCLLYRGSSPN